MKNTIHVDNSINSGQVFLWKKQDGFWYGINGNEILRVDKKGKTKSNQKHKTDFFREKDDINKIIKEISKDETVKKAVERYTGLRILRQDPFQCLISFIISSNSNIQKIKTSLENITKKFGDKTKFEGQEFFLFPSPQKLAKASIDEIRSCGVGYRARFISEAAKSTLTKIDFEELKKIDYSNAKQVITQIPGVGNKVADCVMLFSLDKIEAYPLDRWMIKILNKYYSDKFQLETKTISDKQYELLHQKIINYFGEYAGYSQQFLFKMERENFQKKWL